MYKEYSDNQFIDAVKNNKSIAGALRTLGLRPVGGNYLTVKRKLKLFNLDTSHWTGQGWNKGAQLKELGNYSKPYKIKEHLSKSRGWACEECKLAEWNGKPIPLECHHVDQDRSNNTESNLKLVCRNCHFTIHDKK